MTLTCLRKIVGRNTVTTAAFLFVVTMMVTPVWAQLPNSDVKEGKPIDAIVAVIGNHPIYKSAIDEEVQVFLMQRGATNISADSMMSLRRQVLQSEIDQKVLLAKADQDSINVTEAEIDERLDQQVQRYEQRLGSQAAVEKAFGKTVAELKADPSLRMRAKEGIAVERERYKNVTTEESVSRHDVEAFYQMYKDSLPELGPQVELATIVKLVKPLANQKENSKKFAESLVDSLHHGADFAALAMRYSQHTTAKNGGDLGGFFPRGTFLPQFEEAAFKLKTGEVSGVVETEQGFHIIKMLERRGEEVHLAQILIKPGISSYDEDVARTQLIEIRNKTIAGESFAKLATENSDDQETKANGGSLGRVRVEDLAAEQHQVVDSLAEGQISLPLHIAYPGGATGFQIVKLVRRIPPHKPNLTDDYRDLETTTINYKQSKEFQKYLAEARTQVYMNVHDLSQFY